MNKIQSETNFAAIQDGRRFSVSLHEKWRILKNVLAVSVAFMVHFTAFQGMINLQSSLHPEQGLGTVSLSVLFAAAVVSCIFLPTIFIKKFTAKWTLCISMVCYLPYYASQVNATFYTLIPAGILSGMLYVEISGGDQGQQDQ